MMKTCPYCAESIQDDALKCRYCGEWLNDYSKKQPPIRTSADNNYLTSKRNTKFITFAVIVLIAFSVILFSNSSIGTNKIDIISQDNLANRHEKELRETIQKIITLRNEGNSGVKQIYTDYLHPSEKTLSVDEYIDLLSNIDYPYSAVGEIHSIRINNNVAIVDRTIWLCNEPNCNQPERTLRAYSKYIYEGGKWYTTLRASPCPRSEFYPMPDEFSRSLSLILQRLSSIVTPEEAEFFREIANCVDIEYATDDTFLHDAEGVFLFVPGQSTEHMEILVSPRYKIQDDLTTSLLLVHEFTHAINYTGKQASLPKSCYEDEADAFYNQIAYFTLLNDAEKQSIDNRLINNASTPELLNTSQTLITIAGTHGKDIREKALNYVKSQPYYQNQCSGR